MIKTILIFSLLIVVGYLFGNISNARIICKFIKSDITKLGSGNPGTMNMTRNFGWKLGLLTLVLDMLKSIIPCLIAYFVSKYVLGELVNIAVFATGISVMLGHIFPVFYKFKGGKGVASALGVFAVLYPIPTIIALVLGLLLLLIFQIGSLTSFCVIIGLGIISIIYASHFVEIILSCVIMLIVLLTHHENIVKLLTGKENKVKLFKKRDNNDNK